MFLGKFSFSGYKYASCKHDKILKEAETLIQRCFDVKVISLSSLKWWWLTGA